MISFHLIFLGSGSSGSHHQRKDNSSPTLSSTNPNAGSAKTAILTNPATMAHSREKAKRWVSKLK